jgi:hypothetical protein
LAFATLAIIATQAWIYNEQRKTGNRQWQAMQDTLKEMKISRELENRAWIGVEPVTVEKVPGGGSGMNIRAVFVNSGKSPSIATIRYALGVLRESPPDNYQHRKFADKGSTLALFPEVKHPVSLAVVPEIPLPDPKNPEHAYYIWGDLDYDDIFGRHHTTKFCYRNEGTMVNGKWFVALALCPTHNIFD